MILLLASAQAVALPAGFAEVGAAEGCVLALGASEPDGVVPMWATCDWPDVTESAVVAALSRPERYARIWPNVVDSRVVGRDGDTLQVWQKHDLPAFADREVVIDWRASAISGGWRVAWTTSALDWEPAPGDERCVRYDARWDVMPLPGGGTRVVHEARYASGTLPAWLVRPFLGSELERAVEALGRFVR